MGIFPPFWSIDAPHFIIPHFQGIMRTLGMDVKIIDLNIQAAIALKKNWSVYSNGIWNGVWNNQQMIVDCIEKSGIADRLANEIEIQHPAWIVFLSVNIGSYLVVRYLIKDIRDRFSRMKIHIAVGGPLCVGKKDSSNIFPDADLVWNGTLESAIHILMQQYKNELTQDYSAYRFFPDFTGIDITKYSKPEELTYVLNYGCRFNCKFCHEGGQYSQEVMRSTLGLSNHLRNLLTALPTVKYIRFYDSSLNSDFNHFRNFLDELDEKDILWICYLAPMPYINRSICLRMQSSGCIGVNIGVESGSNAVRKLMGKPNKLNVVESCIRELHGAVLDIHINLMVGYPGETEHDFNETLLFTTRIAECVSGVNINMVGIFTETELFADARKLGINLNGDIQNEFLFRHWALADGSNTPIIRNERFLRIKAHIESLGFKNVHLPDAAEPAHRALLTR